MIEHVRFLAIVQALLTDRTATEEVNKLNDLLAEYGYLMDPTIKKNRDTFAKKASDSMDDYFSNFDSFVKGIK